MVQTTISEAIAQLDSPQEWDLSDLYQGFDDPQLSQDLEALQQQAAKFRETYRGKVSDLTPGEIANCLQTLEAIGQKSGYLYAFPSLIFSADTRNTEAKQFLDKVMEAITGIENQLLFFDLELQQIAPEKFAQLESSTYLDKYRHYLHRIAEFRPYKLSEEVEQTRNQDRTRNQDSLTGRQAFIQLRAVHLGEQEYAPVTTPEGQTASTDAELSALLFNPSPEVRQQAYNSVRNVLKQHNSLYAYILNTIAQDHRLECGVTNPPYINNY